MMKKEKATILKQDVLAEGVYSLTLSTRSASKVKPGQFVSVYCNDESRILPRPISVCEADGDIDMIRLVYRVVGGGTEELSRLHVGDSVDIVCPLGNGFIVRPHKKAMLIGGGIGIPPLLQLAEEINAKPNIVLGFQSETFLVDDFEDYGSIYIATEDGSVGTKGTVIDAIKENSLDCEIIYACGPTPMLKAIKEFAEGKNIEVQLSLEERMACGVGACLGCVVKTPIKDIHSNVNNKRVCKDGPVFDAKEIIL